MSKSKRVLLVISLLLGAFSALAQETIRRPDQPPVTQARPGSRPPFWPPPPAIPNRAFACMKDQGDPQGTSGRDLSGYMWSAANMTNGVCRAGCGTRGFRYAGTQVSTYCFCGNSAGHSGPSTACASRCSGDNREVCGGIWSNSVSLADGAPLMPSQPATPPPPANGGQCVININRNGANTYRHTEIQRWEVAGPPTTPSGTTNRVYPVRWSVSGNGALKDTNGAQTRVVGWTISGAANVQFLAQIIASTGRLSLARTGMRGNAPFGVAGMQQVTLNGVPANPGAVGVGRQELDFGMSAPANATVISESRQIPHTGSYGFEQGMNPAMGTTWDCQWNFVL